MAKLTVARGLALGMFDKAVEKTAVVGFLFVCIGVILVARIRPAAIEAEGLRAVRIVDQQFVRQAVDRGRSFLWRECRLTGEISGYRIGREIVVEGSILLIDDHEMLDG